MKKILYIQPYDRPWIDSNTISVRKKAYIPRAPFEIGTFLDSSTEIDILDLNLELKQVSLEEAVLNKIKSYLPDIVFVSMPTFVIADQVKTITSFIPKGIRVILGGAALGLIKDWPIRNGYHVNTCYDGWGFEIPEMLHDLNCSTYVQGTRNAIVNNYEPESFFTLNGKLDFSKLVSSYKIQGIKPGGILEMSRGCMFRCDFCALNKDRMGLFTRSPMTVYSEAEYLVKNGIEDFHIIDPTFGLAKRETDELIEYLTQLKTNHPKIKFEMLTRPELVTPEFVKKLKMMGVVRCGIGMETMTQSQLKGISKTVNTSKTSQAVYTLGDIGIQTKLFHMLFYKKLSRETIQFLLELSNKEIPFIMQSSFNRPLSNPLSINPIQYDQTVFNPCWDSHEELIEYLLVNLAFPSMDIGNERSLQIELQSHLSNMIHKSIDLTTVAKFNIKSNDLKINTPKTTYFYTHQDFLPVHSSITYS